MSNFLSARTLCTSETGISFGTFRIKRISGKSGVRAGGFRLTFGRFLGGGVGPPVAGRAWDSSAASATWKCSVREGHNSEIVLIQKLPI